MADVKIRELETGSLTNNNDYFVVALDNGTTAKVPYSELATAILNMSLAQGNNISITDTTTQGGIKRYTISLSGLDTRTQAGSTNPVTSGGLYSELTAFAQGVYQEIGTKQDQLTLDNTPTENSTNPVTSGGVYDAIAAGGGSVIVDQTIIENSIHAVAGGAVYDALETKQDTLTFDSAPTENSDNPVKSGGVYTALQGKQNTLTFDSTPTENSLNPVTSGGVYAAIQAGGGGGGSSYTKTELYDGTNGGQNPTGTALTLNTEITLAHDFKDYDEIWVEWCYLGSGLFLGVENIFTSDYLTACQAINASGTYQNLSEIVCMGYNNCYTFIPSADNKFLTKELLGAGTKQMMHIYGIKYGE